MKRARKGDDGALGSLVRRHQAGAYRLAVSYMGDRDAAEDVVQEAFVKAFRALDRFRGDASFRTWLLRITANEAKGTLRRIGRRGEARLEDAPDVAGTGPDPAATAVMAGEAERARALLRLLPEKQRLSVSLRTEEGLSFREIGEVTDSSEGAARVNYFHGIRRLRELME
ncbi:MAG: RNA polymerase sigma factor [Gemmatimonadota bacterium]|nr:RNA polymerase sigma factor [Gemmatimonadota bacterium]